MCIFAQFGGGLAGDLPRWIEGRGGANPSIHHPGRGGGRGEDDITLGTVGSGEAPRFFTLTGLAAPGERGFTRVDAMLTTGHEKGSNTATLTRAPA